ncbi:Stk1 family PASTA domain-containing Ser/Thr kinase [Microtetraspora sp. NBRC 16547]|uniref:Stk1 family PASTA domain-containing Ser/Thr kinase n=1 Tax=Microtetraspora sp. NBRC 16547 TaxID=3030993 RepID=UPI0024A2DEE5|nr:Stk1 family PASTA domain-containing Ser/Thr kinase [Microtetraspora sp. NBRC 16547]GLW97223.1 serine/threonine protein kinase [Microtetraspora sp. NBRC 16547]
MDTTLTDPLVGRLLDGRYRVESRIAQGGMAAVYLALDVRLDRTVALKVMHRSLAEDPHFVKRFIGEAKSVASLSHPNVVQVFDQGTDGPTVYLSMEYVPSKTLREVLRSRGPLPAREALELLIPVLAALGAAHSAGMVHRDVKPENVLLADDGRVKVVDFGLARAVEASNQTKTGMMIGTIGYMSPEQVTSGVADVRSDVYAAGVMLFELITGRQPYEGETPMSIAYRHVHDSVPAPSSIISGVPPQVDALVAAATDRDPARRPADATAMLVAAVEAHRTLPRGHTGQHPRPPAGSSGAPGTPSSPGLSSAPGAPGTPGLSYTTGAPGLSGTGGTPALTYTTGARASDVAGHTMIQPKVEPATIPPARSKRGWRPNWFIVGLALVMIAGVAFSGWWFSQSRYTVVPDLLRQNITAARQQAENAGFTVKIGEPRFDDEVGKDRLLEISPAPGTEVEKGSELTFVASAGPETVPVPNLENLSAGDAKVKIAEAGLQVGQESKVPSDTVARDLVVRTKPAVGEQVRKGTTIDLVISAGMLMPDVSQMTKDQAVQFLQEKGFTVTVDETADSTPPGTVIAQDPAAGAEIAAGAAVRLTASRGPDEGWHWPWETDDSQPTPDFANVPDVRLKGVEEAKGELEAAGFTVKMRKLVGGQRVVGENPLGEQPVGSEITIWY